MAAIFISFVHEDETVATAVKALIEGELKLPKGVFLSGDKALVYAGDLWLDKITAALKEARVVVLMLSKRSVSRPWVNFEAGGAWLTGKTIIPCCYGNQRKNQLPHPYAAIHALNLIDESHFLLQSIHHHLGSEGPPPLSPFFKAMADGMAAAEKEKKGERESLIENVTKELFNHYKNLGRVLSNFKDEP